MGKDGLKNLTNELSKILVKSVIKGSYYLTCSTLDSENEIKRELKIYSGHADFNFSSTMEREIVGMINLNDQTYSFFGSLGCPDNLKTLKRFLDKNGYKD